MKIQFQWNKQIRTIVAESTGGRAGMLFLANEAKHLMDPYVPADSLVLAQNVRTYVELDQGVVHYLSPYAHYQYEGILYVDPKTHSPGFFIEDVGWRSRKGVAKVASAKKIKHSTFRHPLATSKWDQAMKTARLGDLAKAYENYLKRK